MPNYRLSSDEWLAQQVVRVKSMLLQNMDYTESYSASQLGELARNLGLIYTAGEYQAILGVLVSDCFLVSC